MIVLVFYLALLQTIQPGTGTLLEEAASAYANEDYSAAVQIYADLINRNFHDGALYYNLGLAYHQMGNLGQALLNYRRAQMFIPRDPDLNHNLALVRAQRTDIQGDDIGFFEGAAAFTRGTLTLNELSVITLIGWSVGWGAITLGLVRGKQWPGQKTMMIAGSVVAISAAILIFSRLWIESQRPMAVLLSTAPVMSGPGEDYLELYVLHAAVELYVVELRGGWYRFTLPDGRTGWLPSAACERIMR
jgi:tetratricopeptide (TPR) repeat protein